MPDLRSSIYERARYNFVFGQRIVESRFRIGEISNYTFKGCNVFK